MEHREGEMRRYRGQEVGPQGLTRVELGKGGGKRQCTQTPPPARCSPPLRTRRLQPHSPRPGPLPAPALQTRVTPTMLGTQGSSSPSSWAATWDPEGTNPRRRQCKRPAQPATHHRKLVSPWQPGGN